MHRPYVLALATIVFVCRAETIHFTNSPGHLIGSSNFTSYKLLVKDSDPITIIEANKDAVGENQSGKVHDDGKRRRGAPIDRMDVAEPEKSNRKSDNGDPDMNSIKKLIYSPILLKKFVKEYTEKLKNADPATQYAIKEFADKMNSAEPIDVIEEEKQDDLEEKHYAYGGNRRQPNHSPYKDKDGWVTLEAVPWSTSTVSKWQGNQHNNKRPSAYGGSAYNDRYPSKPGQYLEDDDDRFYQRPHEEYNRPNQDRPTYTQWTKPTVYNQPSTHGYNGGGGGGGGGGSAFNDHQDNWYDRQPLGSKPWDDEIITDNGPSNFPSQPSKRPGGAGGAYSSGNHYDYHTEEDRYRPTYSHSHSHSQSHSGPVKGNGEWVLISQTKGYQLPVNRRKHGQRAMHFGTSTSGSSMPLQVTAHRGVRLTVLPALSSENSTFSVDGKQKKPMTTSHGGMLEIESSFQSVESAAQQAAIEKNAQKKDTKKRKVMRAVVPVGMSSGKDTASDKSAAVLAAVGAGMVPATVAMLMPMVLGRKRRSLRDDPNDARIAHGLKNLQM